MGWYQVTPQRRASYSEMLSGGLRSWVSGANAYLPRYAQLPGGGAMSEEDLSQARLPPQRDGRYYCVTPAGSSGVAM
eukprot:144317-Prorocentrum_minimum.AAC.2